MTIRDTRVGADIPREESNMVSRGSVMHMLATDNISAESIATGREASVMFAVAGDSHGIGRDTKKVLAALAVTITAMCDSITREAEKNEGETTTEQKLQMVHDLALEFLVEVRKLKDGSDD